MTIHTFDKHIYELSLNELKPIWKDLFSEARKRLRSNPETLLLPSFSRKNFKITKDRFFHSGSELFIQLHGKTLFNLPAQNFTIDTGQITLIPAYMPHSEEVASSAEQFCTLVISFHDDSVAIHFGRCDDNMIPQPGSKWGLMKSKEARKISIGIEELFNFFTVTRGEVPINIAIESIDILLAYLEELSGQNLKTGTNFSPLIVKCTDIVRHNLQDASLDVKTISKMCNVSPNHLSSRFTKEYNIRLTEYINIKRLQKAAQLLIDTDMSISEISWACGYWSANYFSRLFKKQYNTSPKQYRSNNSVNPL